MITCIMIYCKKGNVIRDVEVVGSNPVTSTQENQGLQESGVLDFYPQF